LTPKEEAAIVYARKSAKAIDKFYDMKSMGDVEVLIEELGKKKGFLGKGGVVDEDRTARLILRDWQSGAIRVK
jgi:ribosome biogenesis GTPase A